MVRAVAVLWFALVAPVGGCATTTPAAPATGKAAAPSAIAAAPAGWWVDAADTINPSDVGTAARFGAAGFTLVKPGGEAEEVPATVKSTGDGAWTIAFAGSAGTVSLTASGADALRFARSDGKGVDFRRATVEEAQRFEAAHPAAAAAAAVAAPTP